MWRNVLTNQNWPRELLDVDALHCIYLHTKAMVEGIEAIAAILNTNARKLKSITSLHQLALETLHDLGGSNTTHNAERLALAIKGNYKIFTLIANTVKNVKAIQRSIGNQRVFSAIQIILSELVQYELLLFLQARLNYIESYDPYDYLFRGNTSQEINQKIALATQEFKLAIDLAVSAKQPVIPDPKEDTVDLLKLLDIASNISDEKTRQKFLRKKLKPLITQIENEFLEEECKSRLLVDAMSSLEVSDSYYAVLLEEQDDSPEEMRDDNAYSSAPLSMSQPTHSSHSGDPLLARALLNTLLDETVAVMPSSVSSSFMSQQMSPVSHPLNPADDSKKVPRSDKTNYMRYFALSGAALSFGLFAVYSVSKGKMAITELLPEVFAMKLK